MKTLIGFIIGAVTVGIIVLCIQFAVPAKADVNSESTVSISDIEQINREALVTPLREAGKTITDPDIASYYNTLLTNCNIPEEDTATTNDSTIPVDVGNITITVTTTTTTTTPAN